jgi:acetyl-CoA carboxylase biotin carboxyl carrier protein
MDIRKVKKLIELLEESGIAELEIREGEETVRISRMPTGPIATARANLCGARAARCTAGGCRACSGDADCSSAQIERSRRAGHRWSAPSTPHPRRGRKPSCRSATR